jgi:hypothetical protein
MAMASYPEEIDFGQGKRVDILLPAGESSSSVVLAADTWVLATIAMVRGEHALIHVMGGTPRWVPLNSPQLAPPGTPRVRFSAA